MKRTSDGRFKFSNTGKLICLKCGHFLSDKSHPDWKTGLFRTTVWCDCDCYVDQQKILEQIHRNMNFWNSNICKRETVEKYCCQQGIRSVTEIIDDLINRRILYTPKPGYIGFI